MSQEARNDWAASVDAIVRRAPQLAVDGEALKAQVRLLALLGSAAPLSELLGGLAVFVETCTDGLYCSVLLADPNGRTLRPGAAPNLPVAYVQAIDPVPIADGMGSCGTAAARREMVVVEDVERSELWAAFAPMAVAHGLRACWSVPILDDARVLLGTLALYYNVPRKPSPQEIDLIQFAAWLAAFVIQRHRDAERVRTSEARLESAVWGTEVGLWESTVGGQFRWFNAWCERFDLDPCEEGDSLAQWTARIHPEDRDSYQSTSDFCLRGERDYYSVEYRIRTRGDHWRWVHERGRVIRRAVDGTPLQYIGVCLDIDRQKSTEAALRLAQDRYELAVNAARLPVWEYDVATDTLHGNVYWHRALGYDLTEGEARERSETWLSDLHPEDVRKYQRILRDFASNNTGFFESEVRVKHKSGGYRWLLERGRMVQRDASGEPLKVVGISLDVDARKRMESALRESEERFRSAFESAAIGMALVAPDGRFLRVNEALCRIIGYSADQLLKTNFQAITHPDDLEKDLGLAQQTLAGARAYYEMEKRYFHRSGSTIWVLLSVSLVRDEEGKPHYFISQIQDITARKHAEAQLSESELRYRTTSELVPGFVFEASRVDGVLKPTWVSEGFERVYGCSLAEFQRLGLQHFYDAEARARRRAGCAAVSRGEDVRMDMRLRSLDGKVKWLRFSAKGLPSSDGAERVIGVAEDISEQMRLATALREATQQEQQRLGREIHDGLGQELTGLAYLAASLARSAHGTNSSYARDLATLESIANQAVKTCRDIARGISPLTECRGSLVQALRHLAESVAAGGRMKIDFEAIENANLTLPWAARDQLYRIAQEAVTNALRHSAGDSIQLSIRVEPSLVRVAIADNGQGLDTQRNLSTGLGIDSMRQRATAIGAALSLSRSDAGGVAVECECPQTLATDDSVSGKDSGKHRLPAE